jgi:hypothetical protein
MVRAQQRFLISIALLVFLAACGQTTSTPTRSASTTAAPGLPAAACTHEEPSLFHVHRFIAVRTHERTEGGENAVKEDRSRTVLSPG